MKLIHILFLCAILSNRAAVGADAPAVLAAVEERKAGGDEMKRYFVIRHQLATNEMPGAFGLLLVLPGGAGGADFLPFCTNVIVPFGTPKDFITAELVAPVWGKQDESSIVWPGKAFPNKDARFTTEEFIAAVIEDLCKLYKIHDGWVFTLGWSSSGHALYSSSFENPKIHGSFIAMSRFKPSWFSHPENAKGKRYYFWHSPDDRICPYAESEAAAAFLSKQGALTQLKSYKGGHGWQPFTFYADRIKEALEWFRKESVEGSPANTTIEQVTTNHFSK
jgi:predicted esterase